MDGINIDAATQMVDVMERYPQSFPLFRQIGVCCINEANMNSTIEQVCADCGVDAESFIEALKYKMAVN